MLNRREFITSAAAAAAVPFLPALADAARAPRFFAAPTLDPWLEIDCAAPWRTTRALSVASPARNRSSRS